MTRDKWYALGIACFVIWIILAATLQVSVFGLLLGAGFFLGRGKCADEIKEMHEKVCRYQKRMDAMTDVLSTAADTIGRLSTDDAQTIVEGDINIDDVTIENVTLDVKQPPVIE